MKLLFLDTETTGLDPAKDGIVDLAAILVDGKLEPYGGDYVFSQKARQAVYPPDYARVAALTGLTPEVLAKEQDEEALYVSFHKWLCTHVDRFDKTDKLIFAGWNSQFDVQFVRGLFNRHNDKFYGAFFYAMSLDVASLYQYKMWQALAPVPASFKLVDCCQALGVALEDAHTAMGDVCATLEVFEKLHEKNI